MKMYLSTVISGIFCLMGCKQSHQNNTKTEQVTMPEFFVEIFDNEAQKIIAANAEIQIVASGFEWTEGPLWIEKGGYLLFSDIPNNRVHKLDADGRVSIYLEPSGLTGKNPEGEEPGSNGLILSPEGNLVLAQHGDRRIAKMNTSLDNPTSDFTTIVDNYEGKRLNSPNDATYDKVGNLYFTDPPYGLPSGVDDSTKELSFQGVYCHLKSGETILLDSLSRPNGIAFSPDESKLYVAVSDNKHAVWYKYDVVSPGKLNNRKLFYDVTDLIGKAGQQGLPDGMKIDKNGYIFATGPGGVWIFNSEAKVMARIHTGRLTSNCAFSSDGKTLYMTADDDLLLVDLK